MSRVVDIHSHLYPDWFLGFFRERSDGPRVVEDGEGERLILFSSTSGEESGPHLGDAFTQVTAKLEFMDRHGIDCSVVSLGNPWLEAFQPGESLEMAREANARLARLTDETDGRLVGMGVLPVGDPDDVAAVVAEVAREPRLYGVVSAPEIAGLFLDDPGLEPVWAALASGGVPLMIHPLLFDVPPAVWGYGIALSAGIAFPFHTTVALSRLLLGGVLTRHPDLMVIAAHGGGAMPFLIGRLEGTHRPGPDEEPLRQQASRLFLDCTLYDPEAVGLAASLVGPDRLLWGTDHPFPNADAPRLRGAVEAALDPDAAALVMGEAAIRWLGI